MSTNTGKKIFNTLTQVFVDTGVPTGTTKDNSPDDPDYVAPVEDDTSCPPPTPPVVLINKLQMSFVNNTSQSIALSNLVVRPQSSTDPVDEYYTNAAFTILPGITVTPLQVNQSDDLGHIFFSVTGLSKKIRTHMEVVYKQSTDTIGSPVLDLDFVELGTVDQQFNTTRVTDSAGVNTLVITFTENPIPPPVTQDPPVVTAGSFQTIVLPTSTAVLNGTASSAGTIASVAWTQVSGPATASFTTPNGISTNANSLLIAGTYVFQFTAIDNLGQSSSANVSIQVNPNPNGLVNILVDPAMADTSQQIVQVSLTDLSNPTATPVTLLTSALTKASGVVIKTPLKGTYKVEIQIAETSASKSLVVQWGSGAGNVQFVTPISGVYAVDSVVIDEGTNGLLITFKSVEVASPTFVIVYAQKSVADPTEDSENVLPNGLVVTDSGDTTVAFFSDSGAMTPIAFTGKVWQQTISTNNITSTSTTGVIPLPVSVAETVVLGSVQRSKVYDYTQGTPLQSDNSYVYNLLTGQGYLII